jgi:hypothetical protein
MQRGCFGNEMSEDTVPDSKTVTRKETLTNQRRSADVFPTTWRYEMLPANLNQFLSKTFGGKP